MEIFRKHNMPCFLANYSSFFKDQIKDKGTDEGCLIEIKKLNLRQTRLKCWKLQLVLQLELIVLIVLVLIVLLLELQLL